MSRALDQRVPSCDLPAQFEARDNLDVQSMEQSRLDDAIAVMEEAARLSPNHETLHARLARAYLEVGRVEDAYRASRSCVAATPGNGFAPLEQEAEAPRAATPPADRTAA